MNLSLLTTLLTACLIPLLAGCGRSGQPAAPGSPGAEIKSLSWGVERPDSVGGIDHARLASARHGQRLVMLIWTDLRSGGAHTSSTTEPGGQSVKGEFNSADLKKPIAFHCLTPGPNKGSLTIDGVNYDLANGWLFLVSTRGERPVVKQLQRATEFSLEVEDLKKIANTDAEVAGFFRDAGKAAAPS